MRLSFSRALLAFAVGLGLLGLLVWQVVPPIRTHISKRYQARGDAYFIDGDYADAAAEYSQALYYWPANAEARQDRQWAGSADVDISRAEPFLQAHHVTGVLNRLQAAEGPFATPKAALQEGVSLYDQGQYVYAQYSFKAATQLANDYPEAWNYLGMTYQQLAKLDPSYAAKAKAAFTERDDLTPMYIK